MNIDYPFRFNHAGRTAATSEADHIRDMIEQFLFTRPGERVNHPDFGSGLMQLVFAPNSPELAATLQFTMQAGLQQWLGDVIEIHALEVLAEESTLRIDSFISSAVQRRRGRKYSQGASHESIGVYGC